MKDGNTLARQLFTRIIKDSPEIDRILATQLVANMMKRSALDVGFEIGITNVLNWKPKV
jgi:hypothetical protein